MEEGTHIQIQHKINILLTNLAPWAFLFLA